MNPPDEPAFGSTRIDAASYADDRMESHAGWLSAIDERRCGYIREELRLAFEEGALQERCRALFILGIAQRKATSPEVRAALIEVSQLLMNEAPEETR
jgi:hypothetical protein